MITDKEYLISLRSANLVKGRLPFLCMINPKTSLFKVKSSKYVVSYREDYIYLESVSFFKKLPNHKQDLKINLDTIRKVELKDESKSLQGLYLYTRHYFVCFYMTKGYVKNCFSEDNFKELYKYLKDRGIPNA